MLESQPARALAGASVALFALSLGSPAAAQVRAPGRPAAELDALPSAIPVATVPVPNVPQLVAENPLDRWPLMYGTVVPVDVDAEHSGRWDGASDGGAVWRVRIEAPGAYSIGLEFSDFALPEGGRLFLYDESRETVFGAYTSANHQPDGSFVIEPFPGDAVIVEYSQPAGTRDAVRLRVDGVIYDYRDVLSIERGLFEPTSGVGFLCSNHVDVNCPEGDPFPLEKRAVVRTFTGGGFCSAALINNTANDGTHYLYTANHCGQGGNTVARFNFQCSGCGSGSAPAGQTVSGATVLASDNPSDGRLLRLNGSIPASYDPYYAGWSRQTANPTFVMAMHHPNGGPKKISIDNSGCGKSVVGVQGNPSPVQVWVPNFQVGGIEGGSSGGPLYDQNNRIRGTGTATSGCNGNQFFGRFDTFWNNTNIATFLDPVGLGTLTHDGFDPNGPAPSNDIEITTVTPGSVEAVAVDGSTELSLTGFNFFDITEVRVDGVVLSSFPAEFEVSNDSLMTLDMPLATALGDVDIELVGPFNTATAQVTIVENDPPVLEVANSLPAFLLTSLGAQATVGGRPGDLVLLYVSGDSNPTVLPGVLEMEIGSQGATLLLLSVGVVGAGGHATFVYPPFPGVQPGKTIWWEALTIDALVTLPFRSTNAQETIVLF